MLIGVNVENSFKQFEDSWFTGAWGIVYITAWMCGLLALYRMRVVGNGFGKWLMRIMFVTLTIANVSNIVQIVTPKTTSNLFFYMDLFWPISHLLMLVLGITALFHKSVNAFSRGVLFAAGLWLPIALGSLAIFGRTLPVIFFPSLYNAIMWSLMALIAIKHEGKQEYRNHERDERVLA